MLREKKFRRQFAHNLDENLVDNEQSYRWQKLGTLGEKQRVQQLCGIKQYTETEKLLRTGQIY